MATDYSVVDSLKICHLYFGSPHSRFRTGIIFDERGKFDEFYLQIIFEIFMYRKENET